MLFKNTTDNGLGNYIISLHLSLDSVIGGFVLELFVCINEYILFEMCSIYLGKVVIHNYMYMHVCLRTAWSIHNT